MTHARNLSKVACRVYSQNLYRDLATFVLAHPHIGVPAAVQGIIRSIVAEWDLQRFWKETLATTYPAQCAQRLLPEVWL